MPALLEFLEQAPLIRVFRTHMAAYVLLSAGHIFALGLFLGGMIPLDLSILKMPGFGWALDAARPLRLMALSAFGGVALTGVLLFLVRPVDYLDNGAFLWKIAFIGLAGGNALLFHKVVKERVRRFLASLSFAAWLAILIAGRTIGFI
jgi:hypothetical protein